jgi:hypothetical protein
MPQRRLQSRVEMARAVLFIGERGKALKVRGLQGEVHCQAVTDLFVACG